MKVMVELSTATDTVFVDVTRIESVTTRVGHPFPIQVQMASGQQFDALESGEEFMARIEKAIEAVES